MLEVTKLGTRSNGGWIAVAYNLHAHYGFWWRLLFNRTRPLLEMKSLQGECGEVAIGCTVKTFNGLQMYLTLTNQTSVVTIQVPEESFCEQVQDHLDSVAQFFQQALISII